MRLKRILALSTAAVLAAAMLTGCPWKPDAAAPSEPSGSSSSSSSSSRPSHDDEDDSETPDEPDEPDEPAGGEEGGDEEPEKDPNAPKVELSENGKLTITGGSDTLTKEALKELLPDGTDKTAITELDLSASGYTSIGEWAFSSCNNLTSICLPDSLASIGDAAFSSCANLTSVTLPDSLTRIEGGAFHGCTSLQSVYLPDSLETIRDTAFESCSGLQAIRVGAGFIKVEISSDAFTNVNISGTVTIYYPSEWDADADKDNKLKEVQAKLKTGDLQTELNNYKPDSKYEEDTKPTQTTPELPDGAKGLLEMARLFGL